PARLRDRAGRGAFEVLLGEGVEVRDHRFHAGAELLERLLVVGVRGRFLARETRGRELRRVTRDLDLPRERELIGREAEEEERVGLDRLLLGERSGLLEPLVELTELLLELTEGFEIHAWEPSTPVVQPSSRSRLGPTSPG